MVMKILASRKLDCGIHLKPKDTLNVIYNYANGESVCLSHEIENFQIIDKCAIFEIDNEFGFEFGYCAVIGKETKNV